MTHYYAFENNQGSIGTCRRDIDDARMDIIDELRKGLRIACDAEFLGKIGVISGAISRAVHLDPESDYEGYESLSVIKVGGMAWSIVAVDCLRADATSRRRW